MKWLITAVIVVALLVAAKAYFGISLDSMADTIVGWVTAIIK